MLVGMPKTPIEKLKGPNKLPIKNLAHSVVWHHVSELSVISVQAKLRMFDLLKDRLQC